MLVSLFALLGALCIAAGNICVRRGARRINPNHGVLLTVLIGPPIFVALAFIGGEMKHALDLPWQAYVLFASAGVVHFVLGRGLNFSAIRVIGASRSSVIVGAAPVFAVALAVPILGETIGWLVGLGALIIIAGSILMTAGERVRDNSQVGAASVSGSPTMVTQGIGLALGAAFFWGISPILIKLGLGEADFPMLGTLVSYSMAALFMGPFFANPRILRGPVSIDYRGISWFLLAGLFISGGQAMRFLALSHGDVSLVVLLMQSVPLFVIALTVAVNRDVEVLNTYVLVGGLAVTVGAVAITLESSGG